MKSINKVILIGHVGKQPEIRYMQNGSPVANFSLATNEYWTGQDGQKNERTEWHKIVAWKKLAEFVQQYVGKGGYLYIEGKISTRNYEGRDGAKHYVTEIVAREIGLLDKKGTATINGASDEQEPEPEMAGVGVGASSETDTDDVPF